jgi:mTERF domain-containing protein
MMMMITGKRLIANQFTLSKAMLPLALAFTVKSQITFPNFCTQISAPSTTPPGRGVVTEFLINNCGLTPEEIAKALRHNKNLLRQKSCRNLKEVLELLKGCGLNTPAQIRRVVIGSPEILFRSAETNIQSKLGLLGTFMKEEDIAKIVIRNSRIFLCREDRLKSRISFLQRLGVDGQELSELVARVPRLLTASEETVSESFKQAEDLGCQKGLKMSASLMHTILGTGKEQLERRLHCLNSLGFSEKQVSELLRRWPLIVGLSEENVKHHMDFLVKSAGFPLDYLVTYAPLFGYSLEKRIIPRYRVMEALKSMQVLKTEVISPSIFLCTEKRFLERYVNKNADSSILRDIYNRGKVH